MRANQPSQPLLYAIAVALFVYGWLSVNIYLPILPDLDRTFDTTVRTAKLTVTLFLLGFSFSQLVWGPLSDRFGRRPMLLGGIALSVVGATLTGLASDIYLFVAARLIESLGLGVAPVLARSVLTDRLDRDHVAIAMAYVAIVVALVPALAPIVGGYLYLALSWHSIFFFLALYGGAMLLLCGLRLPETIAHKNPTTKASKAFSQYWEMLRGRRYLGYVLSYAIAFGSLVGYYAAAPYIFIERLGYRPHEYGYFLAFNAVSYVLGASVARALIPRIGTDRTIAFALIPFALAAALLAAWHFTSGMSVAGVVLPMSIFIFGCGLVSPAANTGAMTIYKERAGASTAIIGFSIAIGGAIFNAGLSGVHITRLWELGAYVAASAAISIASYRGLLAGGTTQGAR